MTSDIPEDVSEEFFDSVFSPNAKVYRRTSDAVSEAEFDLAFNPDLEQDRTDGLVALFVRAGLTENDAASAAKAFQAGGLTFEEVVRDYALFGESASRIDPVGLAVVLDSGDLLDRTELAEQAREAREASSGPPTFINGRRVDPVTLEPFAKEAGTRSEADELREFDAIFGGNR